MSDFPANQPPKSPLKGMLLVCAFVSILIAGFIFLPKAALPALGNARETARSAAAGNALNAIGKTMNFYAETAGNGAFPTDANQLFPKYINDAGVFTRPGFPDTQDAHYMLVVGPKPTDNDKLLGFEILPPDANMSGRNVLFSDGTSEWQNEKKFKEYLAKTEKELTDAKRPFKLVPMNRSSLKR